MPVEGNRFRGCNKCWWWFYSFKWGRKNYWNLEYRKSGLKKKKIKSVNEGEDIFGNVEKSETLNIVVKADVHGSLRQLMQHLKIEMKK